MSKIKRIPSARRSDTPSVVNRKDFSPSTEDIGDSLVSDLEPSNDEFRKSRVTGRISLVETNKRAKKTATLVPCKFPVDASLSVSKRPSVNAYKETDRKAKFEYVGSHDQVCSNCKSRFNNMVIEMTINDRIDFDNPKGDISEIFIPCPVCNNGRISVSLYRIKETKNRVKDININEGDIPYETGKN